MIRIVRNGEDARKLAESVLGSTARIYEDQLTGEKLVSVIRLAPPAEQQPSVEVADPPLGQVRGKGRTWTDVFLPVGIKVIGPGSSVLYQGQRRLVREVTDGLLHLAGFPSGDPDLAGESGALVCAVSDVQLCDSVGTPI